jgi:hypothetical protein
MLLGLLAATLVTALVVSTIAVAIFVRPIRRIIMRIVADDIGSAWVRYLVFAMYVVGVAGGVNIRQIERYVIPQGTATEVLALTSERWVVEVYSSALGALGAITWMLLVFFAFALVAYVLVRASEARHREREAERVGARFGPVGP